MEGLGDYYLFPASNTVLMSSAGIPRFSMSCLISLFSGACNPVANSLFVCLIDLRDHFQQQSDQQANPSPDPNQYEPFHALGKNTQRAEHCADQNAEKHSTNES